MNIDKLSLLQKGWNVKEIEQASRIIAEAEDRKHSHVKAVEKWLFAILGILLLINMFVCAALIIPFIYSIQNNIILFFVAIVGFVFGTIFSILIHDIERIHHKHSFNMFVGLMIVGMINLYILWTYALKFGIESKLPLTHNIDWILITYFVAFIIPHIVYYFRKREE